MKQADLDDTICAISTPIGGAGIGIVRLSGRDALKVTGGVFKTRHNFDIFKVRSHTIHYGHIVDGSGVIDEVLLTVMRAPRTYTREDIVEINAHSGITALKGILDLVIKKGARLAEPGEFTRRAFLNGRIDLAQAEAVLDIINSKTALSLKSALNQLEGLLSSNINNLRGELIGFLAEIESRIDFSEEEIDYTNETELISRLDRVRHEIHHLLDTAEEGIILREGIVATIGGRPNVGKSSLFNALLRKDRAIVTPQPGTTRDTIEEYLNVRGIPIRIVDTAGIDEVQDEPGRAGVDRSRRALRETNLTLVVFDGSSNLEEEDKRILNEVGGRAKIGVINKTDLPRRLTKPDLKKYFGDKLVEISAVNGTGLDKLEEKMVELIWHGEVVQIEASLVTNSRHKECLVRAQEEIKTTLESMNKSSPPEIIALSLRAAAETLGEVTGETIVEDVLDRIFGQFCIGK